MSDLAFTDDPGRFYRAAFEEAIGQRDEARDEIERLRAEITRHGWTADCSRCAALLDGSKEV